MTNDGRSTSNPTPMKFEPDVRGASSPKTPDRDPRHEMDPGERGMGG